MKNPKIPERFESKLHEDNCPIIRSSDQNCHDSEAENIIRLLWLLFHVLTRSGTDGL